MKGWFAALTQRNPIHVVAVFTSAVALALALLFRLRFYFPNSDSTVFATEHYVVPLIAALCVAFLARVGWSVRSAVRELARAGAIVFSFTVVVFLHFNLKLWSQLINSARWDDVYQRTDVFLQPLMTLMQWLHMPWDWTSRLWPLAYHDVFSAMFIISLATHAALDRTGKVLLEVATAIAVVLAIGGVGYAIAPADGPFGFVTGTNPTATEIQASMHQFYRMFVSTNGATYEGNNFIMPLGAMPSLHTAHAFVFLFYAWRHVRWLGIAYVPAFAFIVTEAVVAKWHYLIDVPAGLALAHVSIRLSAAMVQRYEAAQSARAQREVEQAA